MSIQRLQFRKTPLALLVLAMVLISSGQVGCESMNVANSQEYQIVQKVKSGDYELVKKDELAQLRKEAEIGKSVGRYQVHSYGLEAWRLDTATGRNCLLLAPQDYWKKPELAAQGCDSAR